MTIVQTLTVLFLFWAQAAKIITKKQISNNTISKKLCNQAFFLSPSDIANYFLILDHTRLLAI